MNNTFDIKRFGLLLKRQWLEFGKIYLITLGVAFGVIASFYVTAVWSFFRENPHVDLNFRDSLFSIFGFLFITVIASNYFAYFGQKAKTVVDLLLPASTFEKFLAAILFTGFLATLSFVAVFALTDAMFVSNVRADLNPNAVYYISSFRRITFYPVYLLPLMVTSVFLLGSIYFNKFHYIKTAISVIGFVALWAYVTVNAGKSFTEHRHATNNSPFRQDVGSFMETSSTLLLLFLLLGFWTITYVRLKEKQV